jgi:hypothetical protein
MAESKGSGAGNTPSQRLRLNLVGLKQGDDRPQIVVKAVSSSGETLSISRVDAEGQFDLSPDVLKAAHRIIIGPDADTVPEEHTLIYRPRQFAQMIAKDTTIAIGSFYWEDWFRFTTCVTGSVRHCYPNPWVIADVVKQVALPLSKTIQPIQASLLSSTVEPSVMSRKALGLNQVLAPETIYPIWRHCDIICDGVVEVYRRMCCCRPWIFEDPRLPGLLRDLSDLVKQVPHIPWPPEPNPPDPPWAELSFFKSGALDEKMLNAPRDLKTLQSLSLAEADAYVQARPYLWPCICGTPTKVAEGYINPDGTFNICWDDFPWFMLPYCHWEYAYVVKQVINGSVVTIYDGLAAHIWFEGNENPTLTSYSPKAASCRNNTFPGTGAFCLLQDIGSTGSWQLKTPDATGWDSVAAPTYNDGLVFPAPNPAAALGVMKDCNWGGTLALRYHFSEAMRGIGAKYYRISIRAADGNGNPVGAPTYFQNGLSWLKYVITSTDILVLPQTLGPTPEGSEDHLYLIPYDADADWQSGQYHGYVDTRQFADGRFLITLEVFDASGTRLRPNGTSAVGEGTEATADFTFRRWYQEIGPTAEVPFAGLTHMFWWDNRRAQCQIVDLRKDHVPSTEECQFIGGVGSSQFSVGYRAYHPNHMFQLHHSMNWHRGLGTTWGTIIASDPYNVGQPPAPPVDSPTTSFSTMLGTHERCAFTVNLGIAVKTWNGGGRIYTLDDDDQASFVLEI